MSNNITIYTDGSCLGNPGPGGWAAIFIAGNEKKAISDMDSFTTNNKMELTAVIKALQHLQDYSIEKHKITIYTDSMYVKNGITLWIHNWLKNGWRTTQKKPVENATLWQELYKLSKLYEINWQWVKAHASNAINNEVDELARNAALRAPTAKEVQNQIKC